MNTGNQNRLRVFKKKAAAEFLPNISEADNKSSRGRSLLLAGSALYPGAAVLAARAALRSGSGYVTVAQKNIGISSLENPDFLLRDLNNFSVQTLTETLTADAILVGPGFGVNDFTEEIIRQLIERKIERVILDADALTVCAQKKIFPLPVTWIMTPHTGEMARCLGTTSEKIQADRQNAILEAQKKFQCVVLLKGHGTLVRGTRETFQIGSGNSALAKSGTGDVLAGIITALRAQGLSPVKAALLGAYVHGATANLWLASGKDALSMMASDVIETLPFVFRKLRSYQMKSKLTPP